MSSSERVVSGSGLDLIKGVLTVTALVFLYSVDEKSVMSLL